MPSGPIHDPDPGRGARGGRGGRRGQKAPIRKWRLRVASGPDQKRYLIVGQTSGFRESKTVRIGREKGWADLRLTPPFVSSRHCFIRFIGDEAEIFDYGTDGAGSTNGTTIHGRRVPPGGSAPIGDATHFFVGKIRIDILN
ncbi:MAG: FHA domain-containing protein, partial [Pseudomonadota bacterium]